jgi:hypothetical protein
MHLYVARCSAQFCCETVITLHRFQQDVLFKVAVLAFKFFANKFLKIGWRLIPTQKNTGFPNLQTILKNSQPFSSSDAAAFCPTCQDLSGTDDGRGIF